MYDVVDSDFCTINYNTGKILCRRKNNFQIFTKENIQSHLNHRFVIVPDLFPPQCEISTGDIPDIYRNCMFFYHVDFLISILHNPKQNQVVNLIQNVDLTNFLHLHYVFFVGDFSDLEFNGKPFCLKVE